MFDTVVRILDVFLFVLVCAAWFFSGWGVLKATWAGKPENIKDRVYMVKTSWVLLIGSVLCFLVDLIRVFMGFGFGGYFIFSAVLGWKCYVFHKQAKTMPRK